MPSPGCHGHRDSAHTASLTSIQEHQGSQHQERSRLPHKLIQHTPEGRAHCRREEPCQPRGHPALEPSLVSCISLSTLFQREIWGAHPPLHVANTKSPQQLPPGGFSPDKWEEHTRPLKRQGWTGPGPDTGQHHSQSPGKGHLGSTAPDWHRWEPQLQNEGQMSEREGKDPNLPQGRDLSPGL